MHFSLYCGKILVILVICSVMIVVATVCIFVFANQFYAFYVLTYFFMFCCLFGLFTFVSIASSKPYM